MYKESCIGPGNFGRLEGGDAAKPNSKEKWNMVMVEWAKKELELLGGQDDEMQQMINKNILQMVETFCEQGHTGFSASYALGIITRLLDWKPITPLTGEDDEWNDVGRGTQQNKRCSAVFRENGEAYYIEGKVFSDNGGKSWFTNRNSRVPVTFPYTVPDKPEYIILEPESAQSN